MFFHPILQLAFATKMNWFEKTFGFKERSYEVTRNQFRLEENNTKLVSLANGRKFHIGEFGTPSLAELHNQLNALVDEEEENNDDEPSGLTFQHKIADVKELHMDPENEGAIFQVASQFNCLEMISERVTPDDGITRYMYDRTQGPICAMACSPGTIYRNYLINGHGQGQGQSGGTQGKQIDNLDNVGTILGNYKEKYFSMTNGYALPTQNDSIKSLRRKLEHGGSATINNAMKELKVGVHWDTEVVNTNSMHNQDPHLVTQVYSSALPISYDRFNSNTIDFEPFARLVLDATYQATFAVAAIIAMKNKNQRVNLYLTKIGGGAFGNDPKWIVDAIRKSIHKYKSYPLNVHLVHYGGLEREYTQGLE